FPRVLNCQIPVGMVITAGSRVFKDFGLLPTSAVCSCVTAAVLAVLAASVPEWSTIRPTDEPTWLVEPSFPITLMAAFIFGMIDSGTNTVRNVACALSMPNARAQAFAISKIFQALAGAMSMVLSGRLSIYHHVLVLTVTTLISLVTLFIVQRRIHESKMSS
ncbi:hypothetical protein GCK32_014309, partial [Trichostrongylus colubriformis]